MANRKEDVVTITATEVSQPFTEEAIGFKAGILYLTTETNNIRFWFLGREPTTAEGHILYTGTGYTFTAPDIEDLKLIAVTGTATVSYSAKGR